MSDRQFVVAAVQTTARDDVPSNLGSVATLVGRAADRGARIVVLPECFAYLSRDEAQKRAVAEELAPESLGPIAKAAAALARTHGIWLIGGGMAERRPGDPPEPERVFNTAVVFDPAGNLVATYRKIHLFDVDIPGRARLQESDSTYPGREPVLVSTPLARIGLTICYDLRFPELYRELVAQGAQVLVVPSAFTAHTGAAHWHVLLRARAIENQCYVIAPAQVGQHNEKRTSYGHSLIVDPWGTILAEVDQGEGIAVAEIDLDALERTRQQMPCLHHRALR
jgi:deaminated glutathione amidase